MQKRFLYLVVFFARSKSAGCYVVRAVEIDRNLSRFFLTMASRLSLYDVLERLEDDDDGLYSEDESDCEAEGISGYMPEADDDLMAAIASEEALDDDDEGADDASKFFSAHHCSVCWSVFTSRYNSHA